MRAITLAALASLAAALAGGGERVRVAAAADLQPVLPALVAAFRANAGGSGAEFELTFGASGKLVTQIIEGFDVDVLLAADEAQVDRLAAAGRCADGLRRAYARGRLVVWVADRLVRAGADPARRGADVLRDPRITRLAIANPVHAPYGRAAVEFLAAQGLIVRRQPGRWEEMTAGIDATFDLQPLAAGKRDFTLVYGENVAAAAQLALAGAGAGVFARSLAATPALANAGAHWVVPAEAHAPLVQTAALIRGRATPTVRAFFAFLTGREAEQILRAAGFDAVPP